MGKLSYLEIYHQTEYDLQKLKIANHPVRRANANLFVEKSLTNFKNELKAIEILRSSSRINEKKAIFLLAGILDELASFLYAVGEEHSVWKHWISLTSFAYFLSRDIYRSLQYAALGGEWNFLHDLPQKPLQTKQVADQVTYLLLSNSLGIDKLEAKDTYDLAWLELAEGCLTNKPAMIESSAKDIVDFWIAETGEQWRTFYYGRYPVFETPICSVVAWACHRGFKSCSLTSDQQLFLGVGLAEVEPKPMYPDLFQI